MRVQSRWCHFRKRRCSRHVLHVVRGASTFLAFPFPLTIVYSQMKRWGWCILIFVFGLSEVCHATPHPFALCPTIWVVGLCILIRAQPRISIFRVIEETSHFVLMRCDFGEAQTRICASSLGSWQRTGGGRGVGGGARGLEQRWRDEWAK